tara:strand:- start:1523 stop:2371 length:849 start_codon:yes stop_codon:yes gene_type:complete
MKIKIILFIFFITSCSNQALNLNKIECNYPIHSPVPGGVINITILDKKLDPDLIFVDKKKPYLCKSENGNLHVIYPINLETKKDVLKVTYDKNQLREIPILQKTFRESRITIANQDLVQAPSKYASRIEKEYFIALKLKNYSSQKINTSFFMINPIEEGIMSSEYGVRRFINNKPRNRHKGLDIAAPKGTVIHSPLLGKVIFTGNFYYRGNIIYIDHGEGLISSYSHMDKILVQEGEIISAKEIIGTVGETGRVTGPHLHWEIYFLGETIDPAIFINSFQGP